MRKIGIFGGSFNPPHIGHINVVTTVQKKLGLDLVHIIPAAQNPLKHPIEGATPEHRLEMVRLAFSTYGEQFLVDDREIKRGGKSYTVDTLAELAKQYPGDELYLIMGADAFDELGSWKDIPKIFELSNLIVVSRPGGAFPETMEELPKFLQPLAKDFEFNFVELKSGKNVQFVALKDIEISAADLRKKLRAQRNTEKFLPLSVESYIREHHIYQTLGPKVGDYEKFTHFCADFLNSKKAIAVRAFDLREMVAPTEFSLIASGTSTRHAGSLAENLIQAVKDEYGVYPQSLEGLSEGRWVLVDYGSLIVHVFYDFARQEYQLEQLWKGGKELSLS
jgi:nicotinate-nucleotide adenylyltransferase